MPTSYPLLGFPHPGMLLLTLVQLALHQLGLTLWDPSWPGCSHYSCSQIPHLFLDCHKVGVHFPASWKLHVATWLALGNEMCMQVTYVTTGGSLKSHCVFHHNFPFYHSDCWCSRQWLLHWPDTWAEDDNYSEQNSLSTHGHAAWARSKTLLF